MVAPEHFAHRVGAFSCGVDLDPCCHVACQRQVQAVVPGRVGQGQQRHFRAPRCQLDFCARQLFFVHVDLVVPQGLDIQLHLGKSLCLDGKRQCGQGRGCAVVVRRQQGLAAVQRLCPFSVNPPFVVLQERLHVILFPLHVYGVRGKGGYHLHRAVVNDFGHVDGVGCRHHREGTDSQSGQ